VGGSHCYQIQPQGTRSGSLQGFPASKIERLFQRWQGNATRRGDTLMRCCFARLLSICSGPWSWLSWRASQWLSLTLCEEPPLHVTCRTILRKPLPDSTMHFQHQPPKAHSPFLVSAQAASTITILQYAYSADSYCEAITIAGRASHLLLCPETSGVAEMLWRWGKYFRGTFTPGMGCWMGVPHCSNLGPPFLPISARDCCRERKGFKSTAPQHIIII